MSDLMPANQPTPQNPNVNENLRTTYYAPSDAISFFVESYCVTEWNFRGKMPFTQTILPDPSVNIVVKRGSAHIVGPVNRYATRVLEGNGSAFTIKFKPGAFYPLYRSAVSVLAGTSVKLEQLFGIQAISLETSIVDAETDEAKVALAEEFLKTRLPKRDQNILVLQRIMATLRDNKIMMREEDLAKICMTTVPTLHRLFNRYVGVGAKWTIQLYRMQEAAQSARDHEAIDWDALSRSLKYNDKARFDKDFEVVIGQAPTSFSN